MLKCLHTGVFTKIMCQCDQPELNVNFVQAFYNSINYPCRMLCCYHVRKIHRKKASFVAIVRFIDYLCHN